MDMDSIDLARLRQEYRKAALEEALAPDEPFSLLSQWLSEAVQAEIAEPNACVLATVDPTGQPHARVVLLKGLDPPFLYFYTNYQSAKGQEIAQNPRVALTFWWEPLERQVRVEGIARKVPEAVSEAYFQSRPYGSQIGAWASPQSQPIARDTLIALWEEYSRRYPEGQVPRPPHWGGYQVHPHLIEFWQGRPNRLHDRILYRLEGERWAKLRLAP
jgi:pyridoxamine 5'-phosphate oxidase